jgi:hypothetical protein
MALTQMQTIQSLGEALAWLEREVGWGVDPAALGHLCGRIGELYACVVSGGQMALAVNQHGYDVVGSSGERISVKTTATTGAVTVGFNSRTLALVDRVMVLRINTDEAQVETLLDAPIGTAREMMQGTEGGQLLLTLGASPRAPRERGAVVRAITLRGYVISEHENGAISATRGGMDITPVKPVLRELAQLLSVALENGNGNPLNTQQLGTNVISAGMFQE